jgi:hypothetical protein
MNSVADHIGGELLTFRSLGIAILKNARLIPVGK